jgi:hypothetical protein
MSDTNLVITIKVPVPANRIDQAKTLISLSEPLDAFKKALPRGASVEDKIVTSRAEKPQAATSPTQHFRAAE